VAIITATTTAGQGCSANGFKNTATGKATGVSDVQAEATVTLNCPSIGITKTPSSQTKNAGEPFSWTVTLTNSGAGTAVGANISDPLPVVQGVSYSLGAGSDASCAINAATSTLTCGPKNLAPNGTLVAVIAATTTAGQGCSANGFTNTATGKATGVSDVQASAKTTLQCPSISITKTPASQTVLSGNPFSWTVTLTNNGPGTAAGATISDPLPVVQGVNYTLNAASSDATCSITLGTLNCGPKDLASGGTLVAVINATTTAGQGCSTDGFTNTATGKATGASDVQASATTRLTCPVKALIAPTQATCEQFATGLVAPEPFMSAGLKGSTINNVSPGVIFYFAELTVPAGGATINVLQSDVRADGKNPPFPLIGVASGQAQVKKYNATTGSCTLVGTFNLSNPNAPTITIATAGSYIVQIKYSPNSLAGYAIPNPPANGAFPVLYTWGLSINGGGTVGTASINLNKK
jgi:uncharacterized repeat protein (TIGR01451 family)